LSSATVIADVHYLTMIIDLAAIRNSVKAIDFTVGPEDDLNDDSIRLAGIARLVGETQRIAGKAHIRGTVTADVSAACSRCLEPVDRHLEIEFDDTFVDSSNESTEAETEISDEELDEALVIGGKIDVSEIVREQILLAMPEQLFCREDCRGLCPKCGSNRNLIDCNCADDDIDPRWAALKNLN
jgi:uncharacterized protein